MRTSETLNRLPVNRERALSAAVKLADAEGIDAVSMRNLAALLDVVPMALYRHVAGKEDLLNGMIDVLIAEHRIPDVGDDWQQAVRERILSARATLLRHPWARGVLETRSTRTHAVLSYMDSLAGMFIGGGFSANLTHHVMHALGHRIWGFSPEAFEMQTFKGPSSTGRCSLSRWAILRRSTECTQSKCSAIARVLFD